MTRGWKKGTGNWVSTSVLVRLKGSVAGGEATNVGEEFTSCVRPGILRVLGRGQ
jgi:hypothetical protein